MGNFSKIPKKRNIFLNLVLNSLAWAVQIIFVIIIVLSFPLQAYPASELIWDNYIAKHMVTSEHKTFWDYSIRTIIVCSACKEKPSFFK